MAAQIPAPTRTRPPLTADAAYLPQEDVAKAARRQTVYETVDRRVDGQQEIGNRVAIMYHQFRRRLRLRGRRRRIGTRRRRRQGRRLRPLRQALHGDDETQNEVGNRAHDEDGHHGDEKESDGVTTSTLDRIRSSVGGQPRIVALSASQRRDEPEVEVGHRAERNDDAKQEVEDRLVDDEVDVVETQLGELDIALGRGGGDVCHVSMATVKLSIKIRSNVVPSCKVNVKATGRSLATIGCGSRRELSFENKVTQ